jgi:phosphoglycerate dehydrogenase-like enzyme
MTAVVLSLTPEAVLAPVYESRRGRLGEHRLVYATRSGPAAAELTGADYVLGDWTHELGLDAAALDAAQRCCAVVQPTAGVEEIDVGYAATLGVPVANAPGTNDRAVAEWTVMAVLALLKDVCHHDAGVRAGRWEMVPTRRDVYELGERTVGIVGLGRIGRAVARRLIAFEPRAIVYADVFPAPPEVERELGVRHVELDRLCTISDVITLHVPLTVDSVGLIDARRLGLMSPDTVLVNAARGPIVDEAALVAALRGRALRGAALDVYTTEPPRTDDPLLGLSDALLSPHLSGSTREARERMIAAGLANLARLLDGRDPTDVVNGVAGVPRRQSRTPEEEHP